MTTEKVDLMETRQLLLLKAKGESNRSCEKLLCIHRITINHYVRLFRSSGHSYENLLALEDRQLSDLSPTRDPLDKERYSILSSKFTDFEKELKKPGCTRESLWKDYYQKHPGGYSYSQFNEHFARWRHKKNISGKLTHKAGYKVYVDYTAKNFK